MITHEHIRVQPARRIGRSWWLPARRIGLVGRAAWAVTAATCIAILVTACLVSPDDRGYGTHEGLGFSPCPYPLTIGLPCPTCGMTTAFAYMMHGQPGRAFYAQPAGAVLCVGVVALLAFSLAVAVRGKLALPDIERMGPVRVMLSIGFFLLAGWGFKLAAGFVTGELPLRW